MKIVYVDSDFKCHTLNDGTMTAVENNFFSGKCDTFIEGYRYIPSGKSWTNSDGDVFNGPMVAPWKDYFELDAAQRAYEQQKLKEYEALINELYAEVSS